MPNLFFFIYHLYPTPTRNRIVSLCFERYVRTRFVVAVSEVSGSPVFHLKVGRPVKCLSARTQQANLPACSPQFPINAERHAGKLWTPFFKVIWYDSTRGMNPRSTNCEEHALTTTPSRRSEKECTQEQQLHHYSSTKYRSTCCYPSSKLSHSKKNGASKVDKTPERHFALYYLQ